MPQFFTMAGDMSRDPKQIAEEIYRALKQAAAKPRTWTPDEIEALANGAILGAFAGPDRTFPIAGEADVAAAWQQADTIAQSGSGPDPDAVRAAIVRIARDYGWSAGLPTAALEWEQGRAG